MRLSYQSVFKYLGIKQSHSFGWKPVNKKLHFILAKLGTLV